MTDSVGKFPKKGEGIVPGAVAKDAADDDAGDGSGPAAPPQGAVGWLFRPTVDDDDMAIWESVKQPFLIHPECNFNSLWDIMSMVLIIYSCITIPFRLCFNVTPTGGTEIFDKFVDTVFMIDCGLTFRKCTWGEEGLVASPPEMAKNYFKGWFFLDFFSSFPFDAVLAMGGNSDNPDQARILKVIRIFRMVKILRMVRIQRLLKKMQDDMGIKNGIMISIKFAMFTCFAAHFQACLWFQMSNSDPAENWALGTGIKSDAINYDESVGDSVCKVVTCTELVDMPFPNLAARADACPLLFAAFGDEVLSASMSDVATCGGAADGGWVLAETELEMTAEEFYRERHYWMSGTSYPKTGGVNYLYKGSQDSGIYATCPAGVDYQPPLRAACINECNVCDHMYQYTTSFYWSIVTLTTLGYGDIGPANHHERMFGVYAMLLGASIFAYSVTNMCTLVHNLNPAEVYNRTRLDELNDFMGFLSAPEALAKKCQDFFLYKIRTSDVVIYNQDLILQDMSKTMQEDVRLQALGKLIQKVPIFEDMWKEDPEHPGKDAQGEILHKIPCNKEDATLLRAVAVRLDADPLSPNQVICKQGDILTKMYMVGKGLITLEQNGTEFGQVGDFGIFGVGALFRPSKAAFTATTADHIDLYALSKYHFDEVLQLCDKERSEFEDIAVAKGQIDKSPPGKAAPEAKAMAKEIPSGRLKEQIKAQAKLIKLLTNSGASD